MFLKSCSCSVSPNSIIFKLLSASQHWSQFPMNRVARCSSTGLVSVWVRKGFSFSILFASFLRPGEAAWYHEPFPITIDDTLSHPSFLLNYSILNWYQTFALFCFLFCRCSWWGQVLQKLMLQILWLNLMDVASFRLFSPGIRLLLNGIWLRAGWHTWTTV